MLRSCTFSLFYTPCGWIIMHWHWKFTKQNNVLLKNPVLSIAYLFVQNTRKVKSNSNFLNYHFCKCEKKAVLRIRIRDPVSFWPLDPGSGMGKKSGSGFGIRDEQPGSYFLELRNHFCSFFWVKILKSFDADLGSGMGKIRIRDPGWKKVGSGINIPDPQHWKK